MNPVLIPSITENVGRTKKYSDLSTKLLENNIVYLGDEIDSDVSSLIVMELIWLSTVTEEIDLYINSPGGSVVDGIAIKDVINNLKNKGVVVNTIGLGQCSSMGAYLLAAGTGKRKLMPNTSVMVHSVQFGVQGSYPDVKVQFKESERVQNLLAKDLVKFSKGKLNEKSVRELMDRDTFMDAETAIKYGLADEIIE